MKTIVYKTSGTCAREVHLEMDGNTVAEAKFIGGCSGNTQGVSALVKGMDANEAIKRLKGIRCGAKPTSCPDQLAKAIELYLVENN